MSKRSKKTKKKRVSTVEQSTVKPFKIPLWTHHPDWTAIGILFVLLIIFFNSVMFTNKTLLPPDAIASRSFGPFIHDALKRGIYPLWNPYIFGGMPSFASLSSAPYMDVIGMIIYGIIWIFKLVIPLTDFTRIFVNYLLFGGFVYLLLRTKKLLPSVALFSSIAMIFMPQVIAYAAFGHNTKLGSAVLIPLLFLLVDRLLEKQNLLFFSLTGLAVGLQLLRAHVQICFYTEFMIGIYFIYWIILELKDKKNWGRILRGTGLLIGALVTGVLVSAVLNLSVWEYSHYSIRGTAGGLAYHYATNWSFPPSEILTYFIPSFMGFGGQTYWGPMPFTDFPLYFGLITFLMAGLALILKRNRTTWFFTILAIITLIISFGKYFPLFYGPMFKFFPFFNKFRAPKMIQILFEFSMVVLAAYGLQGIIDSCTNIKDTEFKKVKQYLLAFGSVVGVLFLILLLGKSAYFGWASKAGQARFTAYNKALSDGFKAVIYFVISAGVILAVLKKRMNRQLFPFVLMALLVVDLWIVDQKFVKPKPKAEEKTYFTETPEVKYLKSRKGLFRILPVGDQRTPNWYMYHKIQNVSGYQAAKIRIYQEFMDAFDMPNGFLKKYLKIEKGHYVWKNPSEVSARELQNQQIFLKLMNVRYILTPYSLPDTTLRLVFPPRYRGNNAVFEYKGFLPRIFFPKETISVKGKKTILNFMASGQFDPKKTAIIEEKPPWQVVPSDSNHAEIVSYDIHKIEINAEIKTPSIMVISEIYYPAGWKAFVDGHNVKIYKTDYVLRSIFLKPGHHKIEFVFKPRMIRLGLTLSGITFFLLLTGILIGLWLEKRGNKTR